MFVGADELKRAKQESIPTVTYLGNKTTLSFVCYNKNMKKTIIKSFTQSIIKNNKKALKAFNLYQKAADIIDRVYLATGKKRNFQTYTGSAIHVQINRHGISSTQKI